MVSLENLLRVFKLRNIRNGLTQTVASVLYCSIYHCTSIEKNEIVEYGIIIFDVLFIRDIRIIPEGENMSTQ